MSDIGRAIREARKAQHMTIQELAHRAGVDARTVGRIENAEVKNPQKADVLQRVLKIGIYAPPEPERDRPNDPRISEASFGELLLGLANAYGRDLRAARGNGGATIDSMDEVPPDVAAKIRNGSIPTGRIQPNEGNSTEEPPTG